MSFKAIPIDRMWKSSWSAMESAAPVCPSTNAYVFDDVRTWYRSHQAAKFSPHPLIRSSLHVNMTACAPPLHPHRELWQSRHELPCCCHQVLRHDAPAPECTTISNCCVYSFYKPHRLQASGVMKRIVCWSDTHKVSTIPQLSCSNLHRKVQQSIQYTEVCIPPRVPKEQTLPAHRRNHQSCTPCLSISPWSL